MSCLLRVAGAGCFVGLVRERTVADAVSHQPRRAQMMLDRHEWLVGRQAEVTEEVGVALPVQDDGHALGTRRCRMRRRRSRGHPGERRRRR